MLLKVNFFQPMEQRPSWGSVLLYIYHITFHDLKNGNTHAGEQYKQVMFPTMNPVLKQV